MAYKLSSYPITGLGYSYYSVYLGKPSYVGSKSVSRYKIIVLWTQ